MRTEQGQPVQHINKKWQASFRTFVGTPGSERVIASALSAPIFDTENHAIEAGGRALDVLEVTGTLPNMEWWF